MSYDRQAELAKSILSDIDAVYGVAGTFTQEQLDGYATGAVANALLDFEEEIRKDELDQLKLRCKNADPTHFCNECGHEFLSCCFEHIMDYNDYKDPE